MAASPGASGKRIRKQFATKSEALSYERRLMNSRVGDEFQDGSGPRLSELIARWFEMYGKTLSSGAERKVKLEAICSRLGDPFASQFDKNMGNDSNLLIVFYVQIMPDDFVMQL
ncbi:hypothetical protein P2O71_22715, partial [Escherichia coli]